MGGSHLNLGGRVNPPPYHTQDSALANSLISQQRMNGHNPRYSYPYPGQDDAAMGHGQPPYDGIPIIDTGLVSDSGSMYGSPVDDSRLPMSPIGRTALDAPLPASFDSQGVSYMARHGPVAASLPSKFGAELSPSQRPGNQSDVLRNLHDTAFGDSRKPVNLGSSPPVSQDESPGLRVMHSQRLPRSKMLSASLPRPTILDDWEEDSFAMEEDCLPSSLHDDVLTPQERMRRLSRNEQDLTSNSARELGGLGMTSASSHKVGSPLGSSPSRFGAIFAKQRQKKEEENQPPAFGHVGSPLRESSLSRTSPSLRPIGSRPNSGDISPFVASPSRQSSMSMISQQLSSTSLHPISARHTPGATSRFDRAISSPVNTTRIDEEQGEGDLVFSMEEEESYKRSSGTWDDHTAKPPSTTGDATTEQEAASPSVVEDAKEDKQYLNELDSLYDPRA